MTNQTFELPPMIGTLAELPTHVQDVIREYAKAAVRMRLAGEGFRRVGAADFHMSAEYDLVIGTDLFVRLGQQEESIPVSANVHQRVPVPAAGAQEVAAGVVNLRGDSSEHDAQAAGSAGPHGANAIPISPGQCFAPACDCEPEQGCLQQIPATFHPNSIHDALRTAAEAAFLWTNQRQEERSGKPFTYRDLEDAFEAGAAHGVPPSDGLNEEKP